MKNRIRYANSITCIVVSCIMLLTAGCVETFSPGVTAIHHNFLVVDGFLVGNDSTIIRLSRSRVISDTSEVKPELNAMVEIEAETGARYTLTEQKDGKYVAPSLDLIPHQNYRIRIHTNDDQEYLSEYVPLKPSPPLDSITWQDDLQHDAVQFKVNAHDPEDQTGYYYWTYEETFHYVSAAQSQYYFENGEMLPRLRSSELYECWKTNRTTNYVLHTTTALSSDVVREFNLVQVPQASRKLYFSYSILVKQYALTESAYHYWRLVQRNSEGLGGLFDPTPSQIEGNIVCVTNPAETVIGHFSATTVQEKRVFITREDIKGPSGRYDATGYEACEMTPLPLGQISEKNLRGKVVIEAYYFPRTNILVGYMVMTDTCADCRKRGGTTVKPDYWN